MKNSATCITAIESGSVQDPLKSLSPSPLASIIIRTFNEARHLPKALERIATQVITPFGSHVELIVVDSGSTDGTREIACKAGANVLYIKKESFTFGRSLNLGCEIARGEFLVFLSGHCIPQQSSWLDHLLQPFKDPSVGITYGRQVGGPSSQFSEKRVFAKYYPPGAPSQSPAYCNNANAAIRRALWRRFRFSEDLTGLEDLAMGKKVLQAGFLVSYVPLAVVQHLHEESWPQVLRRYEREAVALQAIQPDLHFNFWDAFRCFCVAIFGDIAAAVQSDCLGCFPGIVAYRWNQFYGAWRGHRVHRQLSQQEKIRYFYPG